MKTRAEYTIQCSDVDTSMQIRLYDLENYIIQASDDSVNKTGLSPNYLKDKYNALWVMLRLTLKMESLPRYQDTLIIETWAESIDFRMNKRNYRLFIRTGGEDVLIGEGTSVWTVIDINSRQRVSEPFDDPAWEIALTRESVSLPRVAAKEPWKGNTIVRPFNVEYSDIDLNNHFNSCQYLRYMLNTCDTPVKHAPVYIDLKYSKELVKGEAFCVFASNDGSSFAYKIVNSNSIQSCSAIISI